VLAGMSVKLIPASFLALIPHQKAAVKACGNIYLDVFLKGANSGFERSFQAGG
jgi:hypothetical protein